MAHFESVKYLIYIVKQRFKIIVLLMWYDVYDPLINKSCVWLQCSHLKELMEDKLILEYNFLFLAHKWWV